MWLAKILYPFTRFFFNIWYDCDCEKFSLGRKGDNVVNDNQTIWMNVSS